MPAQGALGRVVHVWHPRMQPRALDKRQVARHAEGVVPTADVHMVAQRLHQRGVGQQHAVLWGLWGGGDLAPGAAARERRSAGGRGARALDGAAADRAAAAGLRARGRAGTLARAAWTGVPTIPSRTCMVCGASASADASASASAGASGNHCIPLSCRAVTTAGP